MSVFVLAVTPGVCAPPDIAALRKKVADGDTEAMHALGQAYSNGEGLPQDFAAAMKLYRQAADRGLPAGWFSLGMVHELGQGVAANPEEAFKFYLKAAERGFAAAQFNVGNMYANGVGVPQNLLEAAVWFRQAAEAGVPEAQFNLGLAYELGRGLRQDEGLALRWYRRSATKGNARAQYNLALMLEQGRGAPADPVEAMTLYRQAAAQNFAPAQNNLGILLAEGRGVPTNMVEAFAWLSVAAANGVNSEVLGYVALQLSPVGKEEAQAALELLRIRLGRQSVLAVRPAETAAVGGAEPPLVASNDVLAREVTSLRERLREKSAELQRVLAEDFRMTDSARATPAAVAAAQREVAKLKEQVAKTAAELERSRGENLRAAELLRETERSRSELERRLASAEQAARSAMRTTSAKEVAGTTPVDGNLDLAKLAALYPRVAALVAENARLRDDVKQPSLEIADLNAQLRILQAQNSGAGVAAPAVPPAKAEADAELMRRIVVLRRTIDKLAEESRRNANLLADFSLLKQDYDRLRKAAPAVH